MQFRDLHRQYERLKPEMDAAIAGVLEDAHYISGPQVKALEESLAQYAGVKHCISCANGTDALSLILHAWGVGPGDAVFVSDFTFFSSAECPACEGATPIFVDVRKDTFNMDPDCLERCIQAVQEQGRLKPKAIVAVDIFGLPADFPRIEAIAKKYDLLLLEDGAQAFGGSLNGKMACSFGDAAITSFFPAKPLGCYGDGGAVFTDNDELAALIHSLAIHGKGTEKYDNVRLGRNSRLDTLQAAILQVKLEAFRRFELRDIEEAAAYYTRRFGDKVRTPIIPEGYTSAWAQYSILLRDEDERRRVMAALKGQEIPAMIYYPRGMHQQTAFASIQAQQVCGCTASADLCSRVLALPLSPYITREEQDQVIDAILKEIQ